MQDRVKFRILGGAILLAVVAAMVPLLSARHQVKVQLLNESVKPAPKPPAITIDLTQTPSDALAVVAPAPAVVDPAPATIAARPAANTATLATSKNYTVVTAASTNTEAAPKIITNQTASNTNVAPAKIIITKNTNTAALTTSISKTAAKPVVAASAKPLTTAASTNKQLITKAPTITAEANDNTANKILANTKPTWTVQMGTFSNLNNAQRMLAKLQKDGFTTYSKSLQTSSGRKLLQVFVGPQTTKAAATDILQQLQQTYAMKGLLKKTS